MKLRLKLTAEQAKDAIENMDSWIDDSYIDVRTLSENIEYWPASIDKKFFLPGDRILINSGNNVVGVRKTPTGHELLLDSRRHGMASPTISGVLYTAGLVGETTLLAPTTDGKAAKVLFYDSLRTDCAWWAVGLDHPMVKDIKEKARELSLTLTPPEPGMELSFDGVPVWAFPCDWENAQNFKWDAIAYRRAGASGISL